MSLVKRLLPKHLWTRDRNLCNAGFKERVSKLIQTLENVERSLQFTNILHHKKLKRLWQRKKSKSRPSKKSLQSTLRPPTLSRAQSSVTTKRRRSSRNRSSSIPSAPSTALSGTLWTTFTRSVQKRNELSSVSSTWLRPRTPI